MITLLLITLLTAPMPTAAATNGTTTTTVVAQQSTTTTASVDASTSTGPPSHSEHSEHAHNASTTHANDHHNNHTESDAWTAALAQLCAAMPFMSACQVDALLCAGEAGADSPLCEPMALVKFTCVADPGMQVRCAQTRLATRSFF